MQRGPHLQMTGEDFFVVRVDASPSSTAVPGGSFVTVESGPHQSLERAMHSLANPRLRVGAFEGCPGRGLWGRGAGWAWQADGRQNPGPARTPCTAAGASWTGSAKHAPPGPMPCRLTCFQTSCSCPTASPSGSRTSPHPSSPAWSSRARAWPRPVSSSGGWRVGGFGRAVGCVRKGQGELGACMRACWRGCCPDAGSLWRRRGRGRR